MTLTQINVSAAAASRYDSERVWVDRLDGCHARILSVLRYADSCQFGDIIHLREEGEGSAARMIAAGVCKPGGFCVHRVAGGAITAAQAMSLTERLRNAGFHIEIWSLTMKLPGESQDDDFRKPLDAGLALKVKTEPDAAGKALALLRAFAKEVGVWIAAPTLSELGEDELSAARDRAAWKRFGAGSAP